MKSNTMFNKHNIEIKAKIDNPDFIRRILHEHSAEFKGVDHQVDTYFKVRQGRLKIREGNIENYLIYYERENKKEPKKSALILSEINNNIKNTFYKTLDTICVVRKKREIYFINNIKFHIDNIPELGAFVEIEAMFTTPNNIDAYKQVEKFIKLFNIREDNIIDYSYSDMLMNMSSKSVTTHKIFRNFTYHNLYCLIRKYIAKQIFNNKILGKIENQG